MRGDIVIVGGGWSGCAAAIAARRAGAERVVVVERSDELLGTGLVGGIMRNNGRFTAAEEMAALGGADLFEVCDAHSRHRNIAFPGHAHAWLYDVNTIAHGVRTALLDHDIEIWLQSRVNGVEMSDGAIEAVVLDSGITVTGDAFIDATGTAGSQVFCTDHGNGCVMCVIRCPTFGPRASLTGLAGVAEVSGRKADGTIGAMSGSCKLNKETIDPALVEELERTGVLVVALPEHLVSVDKLAGKACQQYAGADFATNVIVLDTGQAKLMTSYMPLHELRQVPGFERVRYEDPYAGTLGNSMRYSAMSPRTDDLHVDTGPANLWCCGEKAGLLVGHTEAIATGTLAGHNAMRWLAGVDPLTLPESLAVGDAIAHVRREMQTPDGLTKKYTFSGSVYFERMKVLDLYTTDVAAIEARVRAAGLSGVLAAPVRDAAAVVT